jgi:hypothetical protein
VLLGPAKDTSHLGRLHLEQRRAERDLPAHGGVECGDGPVEGAFRGSSIFIASITPSTSPSTTDCPTSTRTSRRCPASGR